MSIWMDILESYFTYNDLTSFIAGHVWLIGMTTGWFG